MESHLIRCAIDLFDFNPLKCLSFAYAEPTKNILTDLTACTKN